MKVFNSGNSLSKDSCNDSSLMFKLTNINQSIIFTGDVANIMSEYIYDEFKTDLKADYLQMSHHGNGVLSNEIYTAISHSVAFFDSPKWIREPPEDSTWTTSYYLNFMKI